MIGKGAFIASKAFAKKHYTTASKAVKDMSGKVSKRYSKLSGVQRAAIGGFGTGVKYGTFGVGALVVGKSAYDKVTGKNKKKKEYKTTNLKTGKYDYKITSYK